MEVIIQPTPEQASARAAQLVSRLVREKPTAVLGLATGGTPIRLYKNLIEMHQQGELDFGKVSTFNLDEYVGLGAGHPRSYHTFMHENLFQHVNVSSDRIHIPDGMTKNIPEFCARYEQKIKDAGGIDLQVLGVGSDGHIGFNEATSSFASRTRIKTLTGQTMRDNAQYFDSPDQMPKHVITMGIGTILESKTCVLLAFGEGKANAIAKAIEGPLAAMVPASALQLHPSVKIFLDEAAASKLQLADYYRLTYDNKPSWQL